MRQPEGESRAEHQPFECADQHSRDRPELLFAKQPGERRQPDVRSFERRGERIQARADQPAAGQRQNNGADSAHRAGDERRSNPRPASWPRKSAAREG